MEATSVCDLDTSIGHTPPERIDAYATLSLRCLYSVCGFIAISQYLRLFYDDCRVENVRENKNPAKLDGIFRSGSDGGRTLAGYALIPPKTEYQQVVRSLLAVA